MRLLEANAAVLPADSAREIRSAGDPAAAVEIMETPSGEPTARYGERLLHPLRNPRERALRAFTPQWVGTHPLVVFFGFGLGYEVEAFLSRDEAEAAVVVEPDAGLFRKALSVRDVRPLLSSPKARFFVAADADAVAMALREFERLKPHRHVLNASARVHTSYFDAVDAVVREAEQRASINAATLNRFGRVWVRNLIRNAGVLEHASGVSRLSGALSRLPALLCAAGPSLDEALPHIAALAERTVIIAVDTAVEALARHGVEPDFAVVVDPQYWNTRHLDRLRLHSTILISEASAHPRVFHTLADCPTYLCSSIFPLGAALEEAVGNKGKLGAGGSVSTTAWDLARLLGASPVYCTGLDLGFPGRRTHVHGSFFEERSHLLATRFRPAEQQSFEYIHDGAPFEVAANDGGTVLSDRRMMIYMWWFSNQSKIHPQVDTRNLSARGAAVEGIPAVPLAEALKLPAIRRDLDARLTRLREDAATPAAAVLSRRDSPRMVERMEHLAAELDRFADIAREGLELTRALRNGRRTDIAVLDRIDARLARFPYKDITGFLMQDVADYVCDGSREQGVAGALDSARALYEGIIEATEYHVRLLRR
ncbi:MAG: motility associated factor glycosyltransferase family protein [Spirochaetaceae bacterium]